MKMKNSGWRSIEHRGEDEEPDEEHVEPQPMLRAAVAGRRVYSDVDPGGGGATIASVVSRQAGSGSPAREAKDGGEPSSTYPPQPSIASPNRSQLGFVAPLMPNATPRRCRRAARRRRASLPPEQPDGERPRRRPSGGAIPSSGGSCGAVPSHASWSPWTPGGVKSPIWIRTSGSRPAAGRPRPGTSRRRTSGSRWPSPRGSSARSRRRSSPIANSDDIPSRNAAT